MKQTDPKIISEGQDKLEILKGIRGSVFGMHNRIANDPQLLQEFINLFSLTNQEEMHIPKKYREMIVMAIGAAKGVESTIQVHAKNAAKAGATVEELSEVLRIILFSCGVTSLIPASTIFEEIPERSESQEE